jgi:glycolate oxidase
VSALLLNWLADGLTAGAVVSDPQVTSAYARDQTPTLPSGTPAAVCFPTSTAEVSHVLQVASQCSVPVVTRGAGSGLAGAANASEGCVVLVTTRMNQVLDVNVADQYAVVQPGVITADLKRTATEHGLYYPPDPASHTSCTVGGNIATNAGGLCCVKYGVTRDYVLGLEAVLADGTVLRTGRRTIKGVAGYDLTSLLVGSEGTLAVITEATLRLRPAPEPVSTLAAFFPTLAAAGQAVVALTAGPTLPSLLELMDNTTICAVEDQHRMDLDRDAAALLLLQVEGGVERELAGMSAVCEANGSTMTAVTTDQAEGSQLMAARRLAYPALEQRGTTLLDDVSVPRSRIPELLAGIERLADSHRTLVGTFGHAGDGNFHPTIIFDAQDASASEAALLTFDAIVRLALALGGTVTGEHGVGLLKKQYLQLELDDGARQAHKAIKAALDPAGILNPGKVH